MTVFDSHIDRNGFYVYQLVRDSAIVYVGQTGSLATRFTGHQIKDFTQVRYHQVNTRQEALETEARLIHEMHPPENKACPVCPYYQVLQFGPDDPLYRQFVMMA